MKKVPLIIICGPTAVGKSGLAVSIAENKGEIISADSMQVYKYLDIGTAKPDNDLLLRTPHHLISIITPDKDFTAYDFVSKAEVIINKINSKGLLPFIVGGTGLYIHSLIYGLSEAPGRDEDFRRELNDIRDDKGLAFLYDRLKTVDSAYANIIDINDKIRIIRALEVYHLTGKPLSYYTQKHNKEEKYDSLWIGLTLPREDLYERINWRTELMYNNGLIEETKALLDKGIEEEILKKKGIGYREIIEYIHNRMTLDEAMEETKKRTRNYAKRQITWFKKEKRIKWFNPGDIKQLNVYIKDWENS